MLWKLKGWLVGLTGSVCLVSVSEVINDGYRGGHPHTGLGGCGVVDMVREGERLDG